MGGIFSMVNEKVVLITGAASGIGLAIATEFANHGAKVVMSDIDEVAVQTVANKLVSKGHTCVGIKCDVTVEQDIQKVINWTIEKYQGLDILINNAGMQYVASIDNFPTEKFELLIKVMLIAPFIATKYAFSIMKQQHFGRIINIASINGLVGFAGKAAYNSAKHGVIGLTKVAALEGADFGITVNALCPGYVDTQLVRNQLHDLAQERKVPLEKVMEEIIFPLVPQKRLLSVEEISNYALFLASEGAKGITGQAVVIDGGYTAQ